MPCQIEKIAKHVGLDMDTDQDEEADENGDLTYAYDATADDLGPSAP